MNLAVMEILLMAWRQNNVIFKGCCQSAVPLLSQYGKEIHMQISFYDTRISDEGTTTLIKEKTMHYEAAYLQTPESISKMMCTLVNMDKLAEEHCYMVALNSKCRIIGMFLISKGTVDVSLINPREVLIRALLIGASQIVFSHNHPSGITTPSKFDITVTKQLREACELIHIPLTDHIIIGKNNYFSFHEAGML